ncbi:hypothetical protein EA58_14170 [Photobacterium galatheae]|uniref:Uncharacterized protein n=2 Tax=Photobacterium galatheae TaxID=1654360 RepID=A0A066RP50_9GAMM|nr:hypothetical protein EA58_14170 [Photobacterium galatheae]
MMSKKFETKIALSLAIASFVPFSNAAIDRTSVEKDIQSASVIARELKVGEQSFHLTFYSRPPKGTFKSIANADYVEIWHGKDQTPYALLNISGLTQEPAESLRRLMFFGIEMDSFDARATKRHSRLMQMVKSPYLKYMPPRQQLVVGYDLGVAPAYSSACSTKASSLVLSSGGVFKDETCEPTGLKVLYSVNITEQVFPWDVNTVFTSSEPYSLTERLDGIKTVESLKKRMSCEETPITNEGYGATVDRYSCQKGNDLVVLKHNSSHHQWNGYLLVDRNTFNQYGAPHKVPLTNWIFQELDVR